MSFLALQAAALIDPGPDGYNLNPTAILVLYRLAHHHNRDTSRCFPSQATLARGSNASVRAVQMAIKDLIAAGLIKVAPPVGAISSGGRPADAYTLSFVAQMVRRFPAMFASNDRRDFGATISENGAMDSPQHRKEQGNLTNPPTPQGGRAPSKPKFSEEAVALAEQLWSDTPKGGRKNTGKDELLRAVQAALNRGGDPTEIRAALAEYYGAENNAREDHRYAKALSRMLEQDRWRQWIPDDDAPARPGAPAKPVDTRTPEEVAAQVEHVWRTTLAAYYENGAWPRNPSYGREPGKLGCVVPPHILAEFEPAQ